MCQQIKEEPANHPEQNRICASHPDLLAREAIGEGRQPLDNLRLDLGLGLPLLHRKLALPFGHVAATLIVHAARLEHGQQLARGMKIQRQVGQVIDADTQSSDEQDRHDQDVIFAKKGAGGGCFHGEEYFNAKRGVSEKTPFLEWSRLCTRMSRITRIHTEKL